MKAAISTYSQSANRSKLHLQRDSMYQAEYRTFDLNQDSVYQPHT